MMGYRNYTRFNISTHSVQQCYTSYANRQGSFPLQLARSSEVSQSRLQSLWKSTELDYTKHEIGNIW